MLGMLVLAAHDLRLLLRTADITAAMSVEALMGTDAVFAADLQALRPHPGQAASAANLRGLLRDSAIMESHRDPDCTRVQDAYSLRCSPQVHGAVRDTLEHAETVAARELASAIDNPVVLPDGRVESNGNFHGAPLAYVLDFLAIAVADLASISERRTDRFLDVARSSGLPPFLADDPGVDSGHMIAQYTAGRDRVGAQAAGRARLRRLDPVLRHAGGPRLDGLVGRPQAAPRRSTGWAGSSRSSCSPRPADWTCGRPSPRPPPRPPSSRGCARGSRARVRTAIWAPRSTRPMITS